MNKLFITAVGSFVGLASMALGNITFQTSFGSGETPAYATGEINGQNNWIYTPATGRLPSSGVTIKDSGTINTLSISQRHLFIDANRTNNTSTSRMDQWLRLSSLPVSLNNPVTYFTYTVAMGDNDYTNVVANNSETFFSVTNNGTAGGFGGYYIAIKTSALPTGSGINAIEIGSGGTGNQTVYNPSPAIAQDTFYTLTLAAYASGGNVTSLAGWLNPTLVNGVPQGIANVTHTLTTPIAVQTGLQIRAQNQPTAITGITIAVPEPATYAAVLGLLALGVVAWRRLK